jgi:hypothetical protein
MNCDSYSCIVTWRSYRPKRVVLNGWYSWSKVFRTYGRMFLTALHSNVDSNQGTGENIGFDIYYHLCRWWFQGCSLSGVYICEIHKLSVVNRHYSPIHIHCAGRPIEGLTRHQSLGNDERIKTVTMLSVDFTCLIPIASNGPRRTAGEIIALLRPSHIMPFFPYYRRWLHYWSISLNYAGLLTVQIRNYCACQSMCTLNGEI